MSRPRVRHRLGATQVSAWIKSANCEGAWNEIVPAEIKLNGSVRADTRGPCATPEGKTPPCKVAFFSTVDHSVLAERQFVD